MKPIFLPILLLFVVARGYSSTLTDSTVSSPVSYEATYVGDAYGNLHGGLKTGAGFLGMANLKIGFDTEAAHLWKGGNFFVNGASTHGKSPSKFYTGDFQVVSNIDAGNLIYLHEFWYSQQLKKVNFTIGLQDLNAQFAGTENGSYYLNSSFGIPPVISDNVPVPIFPLTGLGISAVWSMTEKISLQGAVFDGAPTNFDENPYNLKWNLSKDDGLLAISEIQFKGVIGSSQGTYKGGFYYHTGLCEKTKEGVVVEVFDSNYGFYLLADQILWKRDDDKKIDLFTQFAWSPGELNSNNLYAGGGLNAFGFFSSRYENTLGIAFAYAGFHKGLHKHETTVECFYKIQLNQYFSIQPDFQYIINPAGIDDELANAFIGFVRLGIQF